MDGERELLNFVIISVWVTSLYFPLSIPVEQRVSFPRSLRPLTITNGRNRREFDIASLIRACHRWLYCYVNGSSWGIFESPPSQLLLLEGVEYRFLLETRSFARIGRSSDGEIERALVFSLFSAHIWSFVCVLASKKGPRDAKKINTRPTRKGGQDARNEKCSKLRFYWFGQQQQQRNIIVRVGVSWKGIRRGNMLHMLKG